MGTSTSIEGNRQWRDSGFGPVSTELPTIDELDVPVTEPGYPPPRPPASKKAVIFKPGNFTLVDNTARETPDDKALDFDTLLNHIASGWRSDLEKLRAVFVWLGTRRPDEKENATSTNKSLFGCRSPNEVNYAEASDKSPLDCLKLIWDKRSSYTSLFTILCRKLGFPCVIVRGYGKSLSYEVGDSVEKIHDLSAVWTCVHVAGSWRIVFPEWAYTGVINYRSGAYTKVEAKGVAVREKEKASKGVNVLTLDEFYFLTDPDKLVYIAMAKDPEWQLLAKPWTLSNFADIPHCSQYFLENNIQIKRGNKNIIKTVNGQCDCELTSTDLTNLQMEYELFFNHKESKRSISSKLQLNRYVFCDRSNSKWRFILRFRDEGVYKLSIRGGRGVETGLCLFKIICEEAKKDCKPLPCNPGAIGFGPNIDTEKAGVKAISHKKAKVFIPSKEGVEFDFKLTKKVDVSTELQNDEVDGRKLTKYLKQERTKDNLKVKVSMPEQSGEYALRMYTSPTGETKRSNVCNYLLSSDEADDDRRNERRYENAEEKKARKDVQTLAKTAGTADMEQLEKAIAKFQKLFLPDKGDLTAARDHLELIKIKKELNDAILRRHLETLDHAIDHGHQSKFRATVQHLIIVAEKVRDHLRHLNNLAHDVLAMKQSTISELRSYNDPPPVVSDVLSATFLMLGEKEYNLKEWNDIVDLLGRTGTQRVIRRVEVFDTLNVELGIKDKVHELLKKYTEREARLASSGAGTFYVWLKGVVETLEVDGRKVASNNQ